MKPKTNIRFILTSAIMITSMLAIIYLAVNKTQINTLADESCTKDAGNANSGLEIIDIDGDQFKGKMMIITNPARVFCGTIPKFGKAQGMVVLDMINEYQNQGVSVAGGINAGAFCDNGAGISFTGLPLGAVVSEGVMVYQDPEKYSDSFHLAGFTMEDQLILENIPLAQISEMNLRDAVCTDPSTSPFLIRDGEIVKDLPNESAFGGGKNPRTAIGQREDAAILLLVIDGRQADSLGATFMELAQCMKDYGAVNAAAMTGGTSSQMVFEGKVVSSPFALTGPQKCPTAWLVK